MFKINENKKIESDIPIITHNRFNILEDEFPILFYGNNKFGNYIIGSILYENEEEKYSRYIHVLVEHNVFHKYINKTKTYYI